VKVVPTPRVALQVTAPSTVPTGNPFFIQVDAVRPNGRPATDYSGAVAVVSEDQNDCTMTPRGQGVAYVPVRHRVARVLLDLCAQYDEGAAGVTMLVTQDDIAGLTGAGRPTVNQVLRTLESAGAIELHRGRIDVVDQAVLARHRG
jgi:hypothetical protein